MNHLTWFALFFFFVSSAQAQDDSAFRLGSISVNGVRDYIAHLKKEVEGCPSPWVCGAVPFQAQVKTAHPPLTPYGAIDPLFLISYIRFPTHSWEVAPLESEHWVSANLRAGYLLENPNVAFRGDVIYYEGLGDSMLNHDSLFSLLTKSGYRVIAFDYMGQGGSTGDMDDTRIQDIPRIGKQVWAKFARNPENMPTVIGWSTGGLAGYTQASANDAKRVVLIAPGIVPNSVVGKNNRDPIAIDANGIHRQAIVLDQITLASLDSSRDESPVDPIRPSSPLFVADFALDLQSTAKASQKWNIPTTVAGFVLLSGQSDTYVNAEKTRAVLGKRSPQFRVKQYDQALHEIQNDLSAPSAKEDILNFLN